MTDGWISIYLYGMVDGSSLSSSPRLMMYHGLMTLRLYTPIILSSFLRPLASLRLELI